MTPWTVAHQAPLSVEFSRHAQEFSTGVGCHFLLQIIFLTQESNTNLLYWQADSLPCQPAGKSSKVLGFPHGSAGKESARSAGDPGLIPGLGRSPREGKGCPAQYSGLENSMDCIVHGVAKHRTRLSDCHRFTETSI